MNTIDNQNMRNSACLPGRSHLSSKGPMAAAGVFGGWLMAAAFLSAPSSGYALPSFARQMDMQCTMCHTEFPQLNQFGRQFKLSGYTLAADGAAPYPPFAVMLQPSFTHTQKGQAGGAAPGFGDNNNWAVTQMSVFYAGRLFGPYAADLFGKDGATIANKFGLFTQMTYDGVGKTWSWDNTELRFADTGTIGGKDVIYGAYANNNPTLQDPWNSTPAWGFPYTGSGLAPGPAAGTLIEGSVSGQVGGLGAYVWLDDTYYFDVGAYRTLDGHLQSILGVDPTGETQINGAAPYWRFAIEKMVGDARWEFGTFGMAANTYPGRDSSAGSDKLVDLGLDSQYQISVGAGDITASASWIRERQDWNASSVLGNTSNSVDTLNSAKATFNYLYDKTYGATVQYFMLSGSSDPLLYSGSQTGSPMSDGFVFQFDYLPFNKNGGPSFWPRSNVKLTMQYTVYNRFNGARTNFDGAGGNAQDNNTLYFEAWIVF